MEINYSSNSIPMNTHDNVHFGQDFSTNNQIPSPQNQTSLGDGITSMDSFMKEFWYQVFYIFYHVSLRTTRHHDCLKLVEGKEHSHSINCSFL